MLAWVQNNWVNIVIAAILLTAFIAAIRYQHKVSKSGGCAGCSGSSGCCNCNHGKDK